MKVGLYVTDNRPEIGGGYTYGREVIEALDRARGSSRHEIVAIGRTDARIDAWTGPYISIRANAPVRVAAKAGRAVQRFLNTDWSGPVGDRVDRFLLSHGVDLIWAASGGTPTRNLPYVATVWDLQHRVQPHFPEVSSGREWEAREKFYTGEIGRAARVIVGTDAGRREIQAAYGVPDDRIRKLPHPTPSFALDAPPGATSDVLEAYGIEPGFVFYPAQYWPHKNHVAILRALRRLRDEHQVSLSAVFVGSDRGNERHVRSVTASLGLNDAVHFLGFVPRETLVELYRQALAMSYMTFFGPENLPPLEAFALGCPVIASRVPGAEEQLGDAAILVEPTDDAALATAFLSLFREPDLRQQLRDRGHVRARAFTSSDYAAGMLEIVNELEQIVRTWR